MHVKYSKTCVLPRELRMYCDKNLLGNKTDLYPVFNIKHISQKYTVKVQETKIAEGSNEAVTGLCRGSCVVTELTCRR